MIRNIRPKNTTKSFKVKVISKDIINQSSCMRNDSSWPRNKRIKTKRRILSIKEDIINQSSCMRNDSSWPRNKRIKTI